ncbi:MAG: 4Fe-4S dicluster domain-containing protein [Candidatus Aminicenantales bacterium]|nr:4Fe-4S dicluster domain-containing protein [Acidobacteriota bacterium]
MGKVKDSKLTILTLAPPILTRREFLKSSVVSGSAILVSALFISRGSAQEASRPRYAMILVDYNKCTGCRTCETVCSAFNNKVKVGEEELPGLGNPYLANIRVQAFNPDVDIPVACLMCRDNPCIDACPVEPDPKTGRKALYRDEKTLAIKNDLARCIGCQSCADACRAKRVGAIIPNPQTGNPERMCTLCDGDPQCVKYCPYGALSYVVGQIDGRHYGLSPEKIAERLTELWYYHQPAR